MLSLIRTTISAAALVTALAAGLTACGGDSGTAADPGASSTPTSSSPSASEEPSDELPAPTSSSATPAPSGPACSKVWKADASLARSYQGCVADGAYVERDVLGCSSGQRIARYADHFYAAMGGQIHETESVLDKDRRYRDAVAVCRG